MSRLPGRQPLRGGAAPEGMERCWRRAPRSGRRPSLQRLGQLFGERALGSRGFRPAPPMLLTSALRRPLRRSRRQAASSPRRLGCVRSKKPFLQRRPVETPDDGLHLLRVGSVYESEALGFLRLRISDDFDGIRNQIFGGQPRPDVVRCHPSRQIAEKYGEAHSVVLFTPLVDVLGG